MQIAVIAFYAGLNALIGLVLAFNVVRLRFKHRVNLGTGGNAVVEQAVRAHGNFAEYVPFILLLMLIDAMGGESLYWLHGMGIALTLARLLHPWGLLGNPGTSVGRFSGINLTWIVMIVALIRCLILGVAAL
jgi:uncharacterized membrane protein YecN with MAPEG domain